MLQKVSLRPGHPDFLDLPWDRSLGEWEGICTRLIEVPRGLSRHPVVFVNYDGLLYALKELPDGEAEKEFHLLAKLEHMHLPAVTPVGHVHRRFEDRQNSVLITRHLDRSLPYRSLFIVPNLEHYRRSLLDAMAGLLVQLHLAGLFWGDCSLSNTLFRRDAGALSAYLVDAETAEVYTGRTPPMLRYHDLEIMEENLQGELANLGREHTLSEGIPVDAIGGYVRSRYHRLWEEITREDIINPWESYRIQERIRALNNLGFSVKEVELAETENGNQLRLRVIVTDRNFHRDQLQGLTGLFTEENQARQLMNEIQQLKATSAQSQDSSSSLSLAAYNWLENIYQPMLQVLAPLIEPDSDPAELYCQLLEHKWYLSEKAHHDVGHRAAAEDYLRVFGKGTVLPTA